MKHIYKISQRENNGYDTYDSAIVVAESEEEARLIHPNGRSVFDDDEWCKPKYVKVELIGVASDEIELGTIICASFNAG